MQFGPWLSRVLKAKVSRLRFAIFFTSIATLAFALFFLSHVFLEVPSFSDIKKSYRPSDRWLVDAENYPLESVRTQNLQRSLDWVRLDEVSPAFVNLLIKAEDRRFYNHWGVDGLSLLKATWDYFLLRSSRGASTLTMQLVNLLEGETKARSVFKKIRQIMFALKLESEWSKNEILESYINKTPYRGELLGLRAASLGYFGKNPSGLNLKESSILVSLLRAPNADVDLVAKRSCKLLELEDCQEIQSLTQSVLVQKYNLPRKRDLVPVISKIFLTGNENGARIQTSLDYKTQLLAMRLLREQLKILKSQNVNDGAVLILETQTGRVVAYIGNGGPGVSSASQIDGVQAQRLSGSTIKPFVYATALEMNLLKSNSLLEDSPEDISLSLGRVYHPKNYDKIFRGLVGVSEALGSSLNVPAVKTLRLVGERRVLDKLREIGFRHLQDDDFYGPSLALGAVDVTLWELTQGYRNFALKNSVFSNETRAKIFNILAAPENRRFTFGMDSALTLPFAAAVKTGTSNDMRDNWCVGWTSKYTIGVWVGNFNGEPMWNVSGITGAAPVWRSLMLELHPYYEEVFAKYELPAAPLPKKTLTRIRYPAAEMLLGLDPDIPSELQKLPIEIENPQKGCNLYLNGQYLSSAKEIVLWPLKKGQFKITLQSNAGQKIDEVEFVVR